MEEKIFEACARGLLILYERRLEKQGAVAEGLEAVRVENDSETAS